MATDTAVGNDLEQYKWGFSKPENYVFKSRKGLSHEIVEEISQLKGEPQWMRDFRHKSLDLFLKRPMPTWGGDLSSIDFDDIYYYIKPTEKAGETWEDLPEEIRRPAVETELVAASLPPRLAAGRSEVRKNMVDEAEAERLRSVLDAHQWKRAKAAEALGVSRATLWRRMRELHLV